LEKNECGEWSLIPLTGGKNCYGKNDLQDQGLDVKKILLGDINGHPFLN
jgi:hypothetical protein